MPFRELQQKTSSSDFVEKVLPFLRLKMEQERKKEEHEQIGRHRIDYYLAQIAMYSYLALLPPKKRKGYKLEDFLISFERRGEATTESKADASVVRVETVEEAKVRVETSQNIWKGVLETMWANRKEKV